MTKTKDQKPDALVECILKDCSPRPGEEDFWAIVIVLTESKRPIFAMDGSLKPIVEHTVKLIGSNHIHVKEQTSILTFQGEKARWAMDRIKEEPGVTSMMFIGGGTKQIFPDIGPKTTMISFDEEYVTP